MYTFVFLWTPALSPNGEKVAHGMIFACFMMSCMAGSTIAGRLLSDSKRYSVSHYMKVPLSFTLVENTIIPCSLPLPNSSTITPSTCPHRGRLVPNRRPQDSGMAST